MRIEEFQRRLDARIARQEILKIKAAVLLQQCDGLSMADLEEVLQHMEEMAKRKVCLTFSK